MTDNVRPLWTEDEPDTVLATLHDKPAGRPDRAGARDAREPWAPRPAARLEQDPAPLSSTVRRQDDGGFRVSQGLALASSTARAMQRAEHKTGPEPDATAARSARTPATAIIRPSPAR